MLLCRFKHTCFGERNGGMDNCGHQIFNSTELKEPLSITAATQLAKRRYRLSSWLPHFHWPAPVNIKLHETPQKKQPVTHIEGKILSDQVEWNLWHHLNVHAPYSDH